MTPFGSPLFFGLLAYVAIPSLALGLAGRLRGPWILLIVMSAVGVQLAIDDQLLRALGYLAFQLLLIASFRAARARHWRVGISVAIVLAVLPLFLVRVTSSNAATSPFWFLGLSYVTFRVIDVLLGIQDGLITRMDWQSLIAYLFFFPTLSSGPVDRYRRFTDDFRKVLSRQQYLDLLDSAVPLLIRGLAYKFIIASYVKNLALDPLGDRHGVIATLLYMYAYTAFLFFDFAGYSAMAVATSRLLGVDTPQNFAKPFLARNIVDFWNRWHISLSFWFRDHVYMRFVLAAKRRRWFADRYHASYVALLISFGLMGVWHGFAWHFLVYGLFQAVLQIGYSVFVRWNAKHRWWGDGPGWRIAGTLITLQAFAVSVLIFSGRLTQR